MALNFFRTKSGSRPDQGVKEAHSQSDFEIPADDTGRAVKFHERVFGWKIEKWGHYGLLAGHHGTRQRVRYQRCNQAREILKSTVNTVNVSPQGSLDRLVAIAEDLR
jgi:hypothetical protein